jgi:ATP-dependent Clp protease ATP-binding subunit ClpC
MRRAIQRHIEDALSEKILYKEFSAGEIIVVDTEDDPDNPGKRRFTFTAVEGFVPPSSVELATTATEKPAPPVGGEAEFPPPELT